MGSHPSLEQTQLFNRKAELQTLGKGREFSPGQSSARWCLSQIGACKWVGGSVKGSASPGAGWGPCFPTIKFLSNAAHAPHSLGDALSCILCPPFTLPGPGYHPFGFQSLLCSRSPLFMSHVLLNATCTPWINWWSFTGCLNWNTACNSLCWAGPNGQAVCAALVWSWWWGKIEQLWFATWRWLFKNFKIFF